MKFKRFLCGLTAAITFGSFSAVSVSAEDTGTVKKLLTVDISSIDGAINIGYLGEGFFSYETIDVSGISGVKYIDINKWRETGNFSAESVESDFDMAGLKYYGVDLAISHGNMFFLNGDTGFSAKVDVNGKTVTKGETYDKSLYPVLLVMDMFFSETKAYEAP